MMTRRGFPASSVPVIGFCWLALRLAGCSAASHTAHWSISLIDDGPGAEQSRFVDLSKWTVNAPVNGSGTDYLIVASDSINRTTEAQPANVTVSSPTLPAEALEEREAIAENLDSTTTTVATPTVPAFTVFGGPTPNFAPLFGLPLTLPTVASSTTTVPTTVVESTTTTVSTTASSNETTTVPMATVALPTLPPFDMRSLPSLIQMAKLIPAMVRSFGASGDSLPSILPSGGASNSAVPGSLFPALPTSSAVSNAAGGGYGGLPSTQLAANAAPTFQLPGLIPSAQPSGLDQLARTRDVSPFGNVGEIFAVNGPVRPPTVDIRRLPTFYSNKMKTDDKSQPSFIGQQKEVVSKPNKFMSRQTTADTVVKRPVHLGTPTDNLLANDKASETKSNEEIESSRTDHFRRIAPAGGWSRGSAERRPSQISGAERQMRLNLYNKEKSGEENHISIGEKSQNNIPYKSDWDEDHQTETVEPSDATASPYAAPMPPTMATMAHRERPRFMMAAPAAELSNEDGENEKLASAHREIFHRNPEPFRNRKSDWGSSDVAKTRQDIYTEPREIDLHTTTVDEGLDASDGWLSVQRAEMARQKFSGGPTKIHQKFTTKTPPQSDESQRQTLANRLPAGLGPGLDASVLSELAAIRQLPELDELTRGLDLSLLARPGGYATLRQQFLERLARRAAAEQPKKSPNNTVPLRIRRQIL